MKVAVLGAGGQVGRALCAALPGATAFRRDRLDIGDAAAVGAMDWSRFDVIVNAAGYTAVDAAESPDGRRSAWRTNAGAVALLARAANDHDLPLVHYSSEYVFDGRHPGPLAEDEPVSPLSAYGSAKAAGDIAAGLAGRHFILRPTWVTGEGRNFVRTMLGLAQRGISPAVVSDQVGRLTFADDLAAATIALLRTGAPYGTYNVTNSGEPTSWADVARAVFETAGYQPTAVSDISTAAFFADRPEAAARPLNSVLDLTKAESTGIRLAHWRDRLTDYVKKELGA